MAELSPTVTWPDTPAFRYQMLRLALQEHGVEPATLDSRARAEVGTRAAAHCRWQERVLRCREAVGAWVPDIQIDRALEMIAQRFPAGEEMASTLSRVGLTEGGLRGALKEELRAEAVAERVANGAAGVADSEMRRHYEAHPERFVRPEHREARHILVTVNEQYPENRPAAARRRLLKVAATMGATPEAFAAQALRHSECPSALDGGRLGWVRPETLYTTLDLALFGLKAGQVSGVVESPLGYHLLRCDAVQPARQVEFSQAAAGIRQLLEDQQRRRALRSWATQLPSPPGAHRT